MAACFGFCASTYESLVFRPLGSSSLLFYRINRSYVRLDGWDFIICHPGDQDKKRRSWSSLCPSILSFIRQKESFDCCAFITLYSVSPLLPWTHQAHPNGQSVSFFSCLLVSSASDPPLLIPTVFWIQA